jgi:hypothetical protein
MSVGCLILSELGWRFSVRHYTSASSRKLRKPLDLRIVGSRAVGFVIPISRLPEPSRVPIEEREIRAAAMQVGVTKPQ